MSARVEQLPTLEEPLKATDGNAMAPREQAKKGIKRALEDSESVENRSEKYARVDEKPSQGVNIIDLTD
jgi:hypothetical protein